MSDAVESLFTKDSDSSDLSAVVRSLFDETGINLKSVLNSDQVVIVAIALSFASIYNQPLIRELVTILLELKVSDKGVGRKDLRAVLTARLMQREHENSDRLARRLIGG